MEPAAEPPGLFALGRPGGAGGHRVEAAATAFAVVDVETTGLSPAGGDRVVEVAVVRARADGTVDDEYATLVDPGRDVGPTYIHRIANADVAGAPRFDRVVGTLVDALSGAVVVAHNAAFEEDFLAAELARAGVRLPRLPALDTVDLAWRSRRGPRCYRLETCCARFGVELTDAHTALGDARATAALLARCLEVQRAAGTGWLTFPAPLPALGPAVPTERPGTAPSPPRHRAPALRKGERGWLADLVAKLPAGGADVDPAGAQAYLALLADAVADAKVTAVEAKALAQAAGRAGLGSRRLAELHRGFLDDRRALAAADGDGPVERRRLAKLAALLGEPGHFADPAGATPGGAAGVAGAAEAREAGAPP